MQTLLTKVQDIEKKAHDLVESARSKNLQQIQELQSREEEIIFETREKVIARGKKIVDEKIAQADHEINSIKQNGERAVEMVRKAAAANRDDALTLATTLFNEEYVD